MVVALVHLLLVVAGGRVRLVVVAADRYSAAASHMLHVSLRLLSRLSVWDRIAARMMMLLAVIVLRCATATS